MESEDSLKELHMDFSLLPLLSNITLLAGITTSFYWMSAHPPQQFVFSVILHDGALPE